MANTYDIGDVVRITSTFSQNGVLVDPTTVSLIIKSSDGVTSQHNLLAGTVIRDSLGLFHRDVDATLRGTYRYRWTSTGTGAAAEEGWFQVRARQVV